MNIYIVVRKGVYDQGIFYATLDLEVAVKVSGSMKESEDINCGGYHDYEVRVIEIDSAVDFKLDHYGKNFIEQDVTVAVNGVMTDVNRT